jgi:hypothetical protein
MAGLMVLFTVAALVVGIIYYKRDPNLRILTWYIASSLIQDISCMYAFPDRRFGHFRVDQMYAACFGFILFEFIACNLFILNYVHTPQRRRIIRFSALLFFGFLTVDALLTFPRMYTMFMLYYVVPECFFLVIPCLIYFYDLFLTKNLRPLKDQPAFWVITGILFLNACDIPLLLTADLMRGSSHYSEIYSLNYILYIILFAFLIRAFMCPPENTKSNDPKLVYTP